MDIESLRKLIELKEIKRSNTLKERNESSAEHTYGCLMLAEYFLPFLPELNKHRVFDLILYHDFVEVEAGDTFFLDSKGNESKKEREKKAFEKLHKEIPEHMQEKYASCFSEYEEEETKEAQFAHAIDKIEPIIQQLAAPHYFRVYGISEKVLREKKEDKIKVFPYLHQFFEDLLTYLIKENIIDKE